VEAAAEIPEGKTGGRQTRNEGRKRAHKPVTSQPAARQAGQHQDGTPHQRHHQLHRARGVCSVQKWREAARGTAADRPSRC
jgi:hypothetical protein